MSRESDQTDRSERKDEEAHKSVGALLSRSIVAQVLGVVRQIIILPLIGPAELAVFKYAMTLLGYVKQFHFGSLSTLNVRFARWEAAGDKGRCDTIQWIAWRQVVFGIPLFMLVIAYPFSKIDIPLWLAVIVVPIGSLTLLSLYAGTSFIVRGLFMEKARIEVFSGITGSVLLAAGAYFFGLPGLMMCALVPILFLPVLGRRFLFPPRPSAGQLSDMWIHIRFGARVWIGTTANVFAMTADVLLLGYLVGMDNPNLGYYFVGLTFFKFLSQLVNSVAVVHHRRLHQVIGRAGGVAHEDVANAVTELVAVDSFIGIVTASLAVLVGATLVPVALPAYSPVASVLGPLLASAVVMTARRYSRSMLNQADRVPWTVGISVLQTLILGGAFWAVDKYFASNIVGYATARMIAFGAAAFAELLLAYLAMGQWKAGAKVSAKLLAAMLPFLALQCAVPLWVDDSRILGGLGLLTLALCLLTYSVSFPSAPPRAAGIMRGALRSVVRLGRPRP